MSGKYWACWAWVMPFEQAREIAPANMEKFEEALAAYDGNALHDLEYDDLDMDDPVAQDIVTYLKEIKHVVLIATGLEIEPMDYGGGGSTDENEYNEEELWPCFWVRNAVEITRDGKRAEMKGQIASTGWVTYG